MGSGLHRATGLVATFGPRIFSAFGSCFGGPVFRIGRQNGSAATVTGRRTRSVAAGKAAPGDHARPVAATEALDGVAHRRPWARVLDALPLRAAASNWKKARRSGGADSVHAIADVDSRFRWAARASNLLRRTPAMDETRTDEDRCSEAQYPRASGASHGRDRGTRDAMLRSPYLSVFHVSTALQPGHRRPRWHRMSRGAGQEHDRKDAAAPHPIRC
jgi:hypothetical protein